MDDFFHGSETNRTSNSTATASFVRTGVIGLVCTAAVHLLPAPFDTQINKQRLINGDVDAATFAGPDVDGFTARQALNGVYAEGGGTVIMVNVFDPNRHKNTVVAEVKQFQDSEIALDNGQVFNVIVRSSDGSTTFINGTDYSVDQITGSISRLADGGIGINQTVNVDYDVADPSQVTAADIIGTVNANGDRTGMQAWLGARQAFGYGPRQLVALGYSSLPSVATAMNTIAVALKARAYIDVPIGTTVQEAIEGRGPTGAIDLRIASANVVYLFNHIYVAGPDGTRLEGQSARRAGLRARVDRESGFNFSASNQQYLSVIGLERELDEADIQQLNAAGIETIKNDFGRGFKAFGNRVSIFPGKGGIETFEATVRSFDTHDEQLEMISDNVSLDKPINGGTFLRRLNRSLQQYINDEITAERLVAGSRAFIDPSQNPASQLEDGHIRIGRKYVVGPPAERITHEAEVDVTLLSNIFA
jgi:phage tail sheath protein FI